MIQWLIRVHLHILEAAFCSFLGILTTSTLFMESELSPEPFKLTKQVRMVGFRSIIKINFQEDTVTHHNTTGSAAFNCKFDCSLIRNYLIFCLNEEFYFDFLTLIPYTYLVWIFILRVLHLSSTKTQKMQWY